MTLAAGTRLGPYEVSAPLGAGGMGEVYRARDTRLGREVALKVLPEALAADPGRLARFEQEARAASALNHPNIVTIHDIGREGSTEFIAMELVDGKTLRDLAESGALPVRKIVAVAAQIADGLAKAHSVGIVHRDLKPENVMVTRDGFAKILDFGLAKLIEPMTGEASAMPTLAHPETQPGTVLGTVSYMSPEQASGESVDFRSDQFSLGSILYELSTGQKAFPRKTAAETMSAIIRDEPEPIAKLRPDLPPPVRWILDRCLAKDPEERYASTRDLARDLTGLRDHLAEASSDASAALVAPGKGSRRPLRLIVGLALFAAAALTGWIAARATAPGTVAAPLFRRLTFRQGLIANARFTPDGQAVVYGAQWDDENTITGLYLTRPESPESRRFEFDGDILSISRAGELAVLLRPTGPTGTLARAPMTGGVPREVLEDATYAGADFAPDGKELAVAHMVGGKTRLEFPIGKTLVPEGVQTPRFSPRGDSIAFWTTDWPGSVIRIDRDGKSRQTLSSGWEQISGAPCWRPDGKEVWFTAGKETEPTGLWAADLSGRRRLIMRVPGNLELDDLAAGGRALLAHHTTLYTLRALAPGETDQRDLTWLDRSHPADLTSDGKLLLIEEDGEGAGAAPTIYLRGTDGSPAVRLGDGFGMAISPDKRWVLASTQTPDGAYSRLSLVPIGAGQPRLLESGRFTDYGAGGWLPDGRRVVYAASSAREPVRVYLLDTSTGESHAISPAETSLRLWSSPVSPDGETILVQRQDGRAALCPAAGGALRDIVGLSDGDAAVGWTADGRSLYVYRQARVFLVDAQSGQRRLWKEIPTQGLRSLEIRITPDGGAYAYTGQRTISALYVVEGLR